MSTPPRSLFAGLVDDAAMFPPGNASADVALAEHLRYRGSWFSDLVGPLLVPAAAFEGFASTQRSVGSPDVAVVLIGSTTLPDDVPSGVTVVGFEVSVPSVPLPSVEEPMSLAAEVTAPATGERVLRAIADARRSGRAVVAKFRTGGTTAGAFPTEQQLAALIHTAIAVPVPIKLTAGLHHAVRFTDDATGFEHHGFLNVLLAVSRALDGADLLTVAEALSLRITDVVVAEVRGLDAAQVTAVRRSLLSFGCCGVEDPVGDLVELGLVEEKR